MGNDGDNCTAVLVAFHKLEQEQVPPVKEIKFAKVCLLGDR
jgi:hypothetical protein